MGATNITEFLFGWEEKAKKMGVDADELFLKVSFDLFRDIVKRTPVDTGRARANWMMTEGAPATGTIGEFRKEHVAKSRKKDKKAVLYSAPVPPPRSGFSGRQPIFIVNNLPYIEALENGHSKQAPFGMVELAIENQMAHLENA